MRQRVARSRELVAAGRPAAVVARVAGISRQAIYRKPKRPPRGVCAATGSHRSGGARRRAREPDRRDPDGRGTRFARGVAAGQPQAGAAADARAPTAAAHPLRASSAPARLLPGHPARRALASGHDERLGRRARLVLSERRDRLLHPRDRRLGARCPLPRRRGDRRHRRRGRRARRRARRADARHRQRHRVHLAGVPRPARRARRSRTAAAATATPRARRSSSRWFSKLKQRCVWREEFETLDAGPRRDRRLHRPLPPPAPLAAWPTAPRARSRPPGRITKTT